MRLKHRASFFHFSWESLYKICLMRIKERVGENRGIVCTHRYTASLLKKINKKLPPKIRNLRIIVFLQNKMCPFLRQGIYIYVGHYFLWNTVGLQVLLYTSLVCDHTYKVSCFGVFHQWTFFWNVQPLAVFWSVQHLHVKDAHCRFCKRV